MICIISLSYNNIYFKNIQVYKRKDKVKNTLSFLVNLNNYHYFVLAETIFEYLEFTYPFLTARTL